MGCYVSSVPCTRPACIPATFVPTGQGTWPRRADHIGRGGLLCLICKKGAASIDFCANLHYTIGTLE